MARYSRIVIDAESLADAWSDLDLHEAVIEFHRFLAAVHVDHVRGSDRRVFVGVLCGECGNGSRGILATQLLTAARNIGISTAVDPYRRTLDLLAGAAGEGAAVLLASNHRAAPQFLRDSPIVTHLMSGIGGMQRVTGAASWYQRHGMLPDAWPEHLAELDAPPEQQIPIDYRAREASPPWVTGGKADLSAHRWWLLGLGAASVLRPRLWRYIREIAA